MGSVIQAAGSSRFNRRAFGMGAAGLGLALRGWGSAGAQGTPEASAASQYLFVADPAATSIYLYSANTLELTGQLDGVTFGGHNGLFVHPDGRLIFTDDATSELIALEIDANGAFVERNRVAINAGDIIAWSSVDPSFRYMAGASAHPETSEQIVNLVDLSAFTNLEVPVTMVGEEELHTWLTEDHLYVSLGGQVDGYALADLQNGTFEPVGSVQVELGSHGGVTDATRGRIVLTTFPGFEVLDVSGGAPAHVTNLPWDVDGFEGGRNARPRLGWNGDHIFGVLTKPIDDPASWADAEVTVHVADLATDSTRRFALGQGRFAGRWGIGENVALFAGYGADGGAAYVFDVDAASDTFGQALATVEIALPMAAAVAGTAPELTAQGYATAVSFDGTFGAVSHGGDGLISIIDPVAGAVASTITTPTPLTNAGYIAVVEPGRTPVDLWGR